MTIRAPEWDKATAAIQEAKTVLVIPHKRPDGDAIGSALGIANMLWSMGKKVTVADDDVVPDPFLFLDGSDKFVKRLTYGNWDVLITTDCSDEARTGEVGAFGFKRSQTVINLDHHLTNTGFGHIHLVQPDASSAAEVVYNWLVEAKIELNESIAKPLLTGIVTDTIGFRIPSVTPQTLQAAQNLMAAGASLADITARTIDYMTQPEFNLWQIILPKVQRNGAIMDVAITQKDIEAAGLREMVDAGIVGFMRQVDGVEATIVWKVESENEVKVSMRSKPNVDVGTVAFELGGGGHAQASGVTITGTLEAAREVVLPMVQAAIEKGQSDSA